MNAVEIEEAVSLLAEQPFDAAEFPFAFLTAFGNKDTTIKRLRKGDSNKSDLGGVLQTNNIHIAVSAPGEVGKTLAALRASPATARAKARFVLATDGDTLEAEDLTTDDPPVACRFADFPNHFGFFLPLAGITTVKQIRESSFDIRATGRLNRLYVELLKDNPEWGTGERRADMNHFMARLIFCFFAEDTDIFNGTGLFTATVEQMSAKDSSNTNEVMAAIFRAMNTKIADRAAEKLPRWADAFPYVNGGLFSGSLDVPRFSRIARSYLLHIGNLEWTKINPDIFGSMIQAVADDDERGALGMHYTSVPNILKVLNPLFLDDLRAQLEEAGDNFRKLLNLRSRMAKIRVFDPACGSGNFLVIAYKEMRAIEAKINELRGEADRRSEIPLTNFRGIELRSFPAEIARLALIIAEFQCDVLYRGQKEALAEFLPLDAQNWITCGNALKLDWLSICPPTGTGVKHRADDLFASSLEQAQIDFENEGGETYICGNPPYKGNARKNAEQKDDLELLLDGRFEKWGLLDYVCGWFTKASDYSEVTPCRFAFVATNSVAQGQHVSTFWKPLFEGGLRFFFGIRSFKWSNLAKNDAGVTVVVIGASRDKGTATLIDGNSKLVTANVNAYLLPQPDYWVSARNTAISDVPTMVKGNYYGLSEHLLFDQDTRTSLAASDLPATYVKRFYGSTEVINAKPRYCFWFESEPTEDTLAVADLRSRISFGVAARSASKDAISNGMVRRPHQFREMKRGKSHTLAIPVVSSENRDYLPADLLNANAVISNKCFGLFDEELWSMAIVVSRLHWVWIGTVCVRMRTDFSYSNTLGWNTFPLPTLSDKNKADLMRCTEDILLSREAHFPATIADLYDQEAMPVDLREAHERNDEVLERIYIGRRFRNDTERLEKLFDLYTKMIASPGAAKKRRTGASA
ncbi:class I SAM-dependent DNA methyltransferase [Devosia sp.]|uniref:class I SAM-dependent DNA methyltransferase n=1 Tax=Devosia sp. TaxID=1871048 RepID=UPI003F6F22AB